MTVIGKYLTAAKKVTKLNCDFCYGNLDTHPNFVPKRERNFIQSDILEWLNFVRIVYISEDAPEEVATSTATTSYLSSFRTIEEHYTYTLSDDAVSTSNNDVPPEVVDIADAEADETQSYVGSNSRRRSSRRRQRPNRQHKYPGEELSSEEETDDLRDPELSLLYIDLRNII
eukprot:CAMPEP_0201730956 /NCGR_PEP_ID=MMETSP0593-20130828/24159_1 /ASSEMBLY_ACC=CAM_ASM_000672 /TAXON_ID=267983 /ORGANISM="Skeletonema japonicum, Strain CCMP2506" /LENGTH=171 /DNA_ID=CAMNT_0048223631 /DNA_START=574 /DNA_END=1089 /DNA_ORIENTATION=-